MPSPTIAANLKFQPPIFIRKLGRANHWGQPADHLPQRARTAVSEVFRNQREPEISIYRVRVDEDLRRVAIAMNANRDSLHENIAFIAFLPHELSAVGIRSPAQTPGDLKCEHANRLHHDMTATDAQLEQLCTNLMSAGREASRFSVGMMKEAEKLAVAESCKSIPNVAQCGAAGCQPPAAAQPPQGRSQ